MVAGCCGCRLPGQRDACLTHCVLGAPHLLLCRPSVRCSAEPEPDSGYTEPEPVSGFTPADYISFSTDEHKQCHHNAEVWVDAPIDVCYAKWSEWNRLLDFLDLVGQVRGWQESRPRACKPAPWLVTCLWSCPAAERSQDLSSGRCVDVTTRVPEHVLSCAVPVPVCCLCVAPFHPTDRIGQQQPQHGAVSVLLQIP